MMSRRLAALAAIGVVTAGGTLGLNAWTAQSGYDVEVLFDGGYVYNLGALKFVEVKTLSHGHHPMRVRIDAGTIEEGGLNEFRLNNAKLELRPNGNAPAEVKPKLPPTRAEQTGCKASDNASEDSRNNRLFLPNLRTAADKMEGKLKRGRSPEKPSKEGSIILTGGGEIRINELGGCVEYRTADGVTGPQHSMASGIGGIVYRWSVADASYLTLRITDTKQKMIDLKITPGNSRMFLSGKKVIRLLVGSFETVHAAEAPHEIGHFRTAFDDAFENVNEAKRVSLWWLGAYASQRSPGIDCPSGDDPDPWPVPDPLPAPNPLPLAER
jgi:hypothetical protein